MKDSAGVYVVPAFTGLGAPYWDMYARGAILGLTRGAGRNHIIRAALEGIAYQTLDVLKAMQADSGVQFKELKVDGGASANNLLMQFQADIAGVTVRRPMIRETTALGAAYLAGLATGVWRDLNDIKGQWTLDKLYEPQMEAARARELVDGWHKAVERARGWSVTRPGRRAAVTIKSMRTKAAAAGGLAAAVFVVRKFISRPLPGKKQPGPVSGRAKKEPCAALSIKTRLFCMYCTITAEPRYAALVSGAPLQPACRGRATTRQRGVRHGDFARRGRRPQIPGRKRRSHSLRAHQLHCTEGGVQSIIGAVRLRKSTLLSIIAGLLPPTSGRVYVTER